MTTTAQKQIIELLRRRNKVLIMPSSPLDGDSLGSAIALYMALKKLKKEVTVVCKDSVPELLRFLPNIKTVGDKMISSSDFIITLNCKDTKVANIKSSIEDDKVDIIITPQKGRFSEEDIMFNKGKIDYDLIITVDCAELSQLGELYEDNIELFHQIPVVNIDHHISNTHFGKVNYVDIMASSTTELILPVLEELAKEEEVDLIDEDIATLLLTGIITDTGSFQNANTTPKSFAKSAQLIAYGARQQEIIQHIYKTKQLSQLKLWGRILSKIQTDTKHRIVWSAVSQQDFKDTESSEGQIGDVIDELMTNAPGAEVIILIKEKKEGPISVSIRTTNPAIDASKIAEAFGGGGHMRAAGFQLQDMSLRDAEYKIIDHVKKSQSERLGLGQQGEQAPKAPLKEQPITDVTEILKRAEEAQQAEQSRSAAPTADTTTKASQPKEEKQTEAPQKEKVSQKPKPKKTKTPPSTSPPTSKLNLQTPPAEEDKSPLEYKFED